MKHFLINKISYLSYYKDSLLEQQEENWENSFQSQVEGKEHVWGSGSNMVWIRHGTERNRHGQEHKYNPRLLRALSKQVKFSVGTLRTYRRLWKEWVRRVWFSWESMLVSINMEAWEWVRSLLWNSRRVFDGGTAHVRQLFSRSLCTLCWFILANSSWDRCSKDKH